MKRERSGISLLLGSLLALSMLISAMYGSKPQVQASQENSLATLTTQEAYAVLLPLMQAESVKKIVENVANIPADKLYDLLVLMINNKSMSQKALVEVVAGAAAYYVDQPSQYTILNSLLVSQDLYKGLPWPLIFAYSDHPQTLKVLIEWARDKREEFPILKRMIGEAFEHAIDNNNFKGLQELKKQGAPLSPLRASKMLVRSAKKSQPQVAQFFIDAQANINYVNKEGLTALIQAVSNLNEPMVEYLLKAGADANKMGSVEVGTPSQIIQKFQQDPTKQAIASAIAEHLRYHGAHD